MERVKFTKIKGRVSWGSIIAGVVTILAVSVLLSILGSSIGLYMIDPMASNPVSGVGTTMGIWAAVSLLISLAAGSFVAGKLAGADGFIHGFLVWALTLFISILLIAYMAVGAVRLTSNILGSVSSATGSLVSGMGSLAQDGMSGLSEQAKEVFSDLNIDTNNNADNVQDKVRQALKKSGVRELQPEYMNGQLKEVKSDLSNSLKKLVRNPNDADKIISEFTERLQDRAEKISSKIDRNDLTEAIANNSDMSKAEVEKTVDDYMKLRDKAIEESKGQINKLQDGIDEAKANWTEIKQEVLEQADEATNAAATSGLISFFTLLIGAGVCSLVGNYGAKKTREGYEA